MNADKLKNRLSAIRAQGGCPVHGLPLSSRSLSPSALVGGSFAAKKGFASPLPSCPSRLCGERSFDFATASDVDLLSLFDLPPEKAIAYFRDKGYAFSWDWQDLWQAAQSRAFTVAKAMRLDILQTIRDELQTALDEGMMLRDFQKALEPKLVDLGWWGPHEIVDADGVVSTIQLGSPHRLRTIYETNMRTSYQAGSYREMMEDFEDAPYGQLIAVLDRNTRASHRALHGKVFRLDDPFWDTHWPPLDWGCR